MTWSAPLVSTTGPVRIIGVGLLGGSLGLALRRAGIDVQISDILPVATALAADLGAGTPVDESSAEPALVVVATPPDVAAETVRHALDTTNAIVTDIASVKEAIELEVIDHPQARRYVGSHPMAGREQSGSLAADADLFMGRPWVIVPHAATDPEAVRMVRTLAMDMGAWVTVMSAADHDRAVALVSHVPQLVSSLMAGRLSDAPTSALELSGQGVRDVTRLARSDARLWSTIIAGNAAHVRDTLQALQTDLGELIDALEHLDVHAPDGSGYAGIAAVAGTMVRGNTGEARIPGKHGGAPERFAHITVLVPDTPGELGRLLTEIGQAGINIEDLALEHSAGQPVGRARMSIAPTRVPDLIRELEARGWTIGKAPDID